MSYYQESRNTVREVGLDKATVKHTKKSHMSMTHFDKWTQFGNVKVFNANYISVKQFLSLFFVSQYVSLPVSFSTFHS